MSSPAEHGGTRTVSTAVTFVHPFRIGRDARELPPGTYTLHTEEQLFSSGDRQWSTRADIMLEVRHGQHIAYRTVSPADLDAAIAHDAASAASIDGAGGPLRKVA